MSTPHEDSCGAIALVQGEKDGKVCYDPIAALHSDNFKHELHGGIRKCGAPKIHIVSYMEMLVKVVINDDDQQYKVFTGSQRAAEIRPGQVRDFDIETRGNGPRREDGGGTIRRIYRTAIHVYRKDDSEQWTLIPHCHEEKKVSCQLEAAQPKPLEYHTSILIEC